MFEASGKPNVRLFLQDGDPRQNSKEALKGIDEVKGKVFAIPRRSPDMNPTENIFHIVNKKLGKDAIGKEIMCETCEEFSTHIKETMLIVPVSVINKTIASMSKRIHMIIKSKGERIKY